MKVFVESTAPDRHGWCDAFICDRCGFRVERKGASIQAAIDRGASSNVRQFDLGATVRWMHVARLQDDMMLNTDRKSTRLNSSH